MSRRPTIVIAASVAASLIVALGVASVSADSSNRATVIRVAMTGDQEVIGTSCAPPAVCGDPDATGTGQIIISPAADRVCFNLKWSAIDGSVWGAHIHGPATTLQAAPIRVPFLMLAPGGADNLSGDDQIAGCVAAAPVSEGSSETWADLIAADPSMFYLNVHSFPSFNPGAIRAQLGD
jgi:CHRD domain